MTSDIDFAALYARHLDFVWRNLRTLGVPTADLDDAAQDTFVVAYRRRDDFHDGASMRAWLYGIARRVASRQRRGGGRRARLAEAVAAEPHEAPSLERMAEEHEAWQAATAFLDQLPPAQREAFWLTEVEGLTAAQAGAAVGVSANTISSRLRAARMALARHGEVLRARDAGELRRSLQRAGGPTPSQRRRAAAVIGAALSRISASATTGFGGATIWIGAAVSVAIATGVVLGTGSEAEEAPPVSDVVEPREPEPVRVAVVEAPREAAVPVPVAMPTAVAEPPASRVEPRAPRSAPTTPEPAASSSLAAEAALVRAIKSEVTRDPRKALAQVTEHRRRFREGVLRVEAAALAVQAHCALRDTAAARRVADALPRDHAWASGCRDDEQKSTSPETAGEEQGK